ncbi:18S rRNA (guanine1575-N7)-methyltransferase, partial [Phenoliferia sp. Uapishka_3]
MSRPEHIAPADVYYNADEAKKYSSNSRIQSIQAEMTYRCIDLLQLPESAEDEDEPRPSFLLDIGAGSGLSGEILTEEGHDWVGLDISGGMLEVALERDIEGDLFLADIGQGIPFRAGSFDGAISVSVLQWLCNADASAHSPPQRLLRFFTDLFGVLTRGSRAVFQFYPENDEQVKFIMNYATKAGFGGGLCVDYVRSLFFTTYRKKDPTDLIIHTSPTLQRSAPLPPVKFSSTVLNNSPRTHRKKYYLVLFAGQPADPSLRKPQAIPAGLGQEGDKVAYETKRASRGSKTKTGKRKGVKDIDWILKKKELYRARGKEGVPRDSKFTARSRKPRF